MKKENRKSYPSDLTDRQWEEIEALYTGENANGAKKIMNFPSLIQNLWLLFLTYILC